MASDKTATIGIVGTGWRADLFARIVAALPQHFELVGATARTAESAERAAVRWGTAAYSTPSELVRAARPDAVVVCVPRTANPEVVEALVDADAHVLAETPPAENVADLRRLWDAVGHRERVQVAEQYLALPGHAARLAAVERGLIGEVSGVEVSSTHDYHAVSMMRGFLGHRGVGPVAVRAQRFEGALVDPLSRAGWSEDLEPKRARTVLATIDFGDGFGLYDFTDNQWHNQLRHRRIVVRGSHGEIADDDVVRLAGPRQIVRSSFGRYQLGHDLNLDGHDTEHISLNGEVLWTNPFVGARFMDEEIAMGALLRATADWARGEAEAPYPLARACQDHTIAMAIHESLATGQPATTEPAPWPSA
ncbi:MAG: Gfo/Idh/MocA family oxidoreductase [Arachnia sp.]